MVRKSTPLATALPTLPQNVQAVQYTAKERLYIQGFVSKLLLDFALRSAKKATRAKKPKYPKIDMITSVTDTIYSYVYIV